jgi:hypothetical protein
METMERKAPRPRRQFTPEFEAAGGTATMAARRSYCPPPRRPESLAFWPTWIGTGPASTAMTATTTIGPAVGHVSVSARNNAWRARLSALAAALFTAALSDTFP